MNRKLVSLILALVMCAGLLAACGNKNDSPSGDADTPPTDPSTEAQDYVYEPIPSKSYTWGTSGTSGTHYIVAAGISDVVNKKAESANFVVQSTAARRRICRSCSAASWTSAT